MKHQQEHLTSNNTTKQEYMKKKIIQIQQGYMPGLIYLGVPVSSKFEECIASLQKSIKEHFIACSQGNNGAGIEMESPDRLHLSLSEVFRVRVEERSCFVALCRKQLKRIGMYLPIGILFKKIQILQNKYIVLSVSKFNSEKLDRQVLPCVNSLMKKRGFLPYCHDQLLKGQPIIFHITIAKITTSASQNKIDQFIKNLSTKIQSIEVGSVCYGFSQLLIKLGNQTYQLINKK